MDARSDGDYAGLVTYLMPCLFLLGCAGAPCSLHDEPADGVDLPFEEDAVLSTLAAFSPTEIIWQNGPSGSTSDPISLSIEKSGDGFVRQYRHRDGSVCGEVTQTEVLPVTVDSSIAAGKITQHSELLLFATGDAINDMVLSQDGETGVTDEVEALVDEEWAAACADDNPDAFSSPPFAFWMAYGRGLDPMDVWIYGASDADFNECWRGSITPTGP